MRYCFLIMFKRSPFYFSLQFVLINLKNAPVFVASVSLPVKIITCIMCYNNGHWSNSALSSVFLFWYRTLPKTFIQTIRHLFLIQIDDISIFRSISFDLCDVFPSVLSMRSQESLYVFAVQPWTSKMKRYRRVVYVN